jgi:tetraacyldisaccharide 4'-kinase
MRSWRTPFGAVWGAAAAARAALYRAGVLRPSHLAAPVISVGNLAAGGRGKTPIVGWLAALLRDHGLTVSVLSRGYRGSFRGEALVVEPKTPPSVAGDEPVMLARDLPGVVVAVGRRRAAVGRHVEEHFGPRVHVLDDGFQHLALARDLDLVCLEPEDVDGEPMPAGALREFPTALARAHVLLVRAADPDAAAAARTRLGEGRTFLWRRVPDGFVTREGAPAEAPRRPFLLSGIARPDIFESELRAQGIEVVGHARHRDHHVFREKDLSRALAEALAAGADAIVTTVKDSVRLDDPPGGLPILVYRAKVAIDGEDRLRSLVLDAAGRRR